MRTDIFYWKCDCSLDADAKKELYFREKYSPERDTQAKSAASRFLGFEPSDFAPMKADGNHLTYTFSASDKRFLLRCDCDPGDDDYMLAESAVMNSLHSVGFAVPPVYATDISRSSFPFRWQIMEMMSSPCLKVFNENGTLDRPAIAAEFGRFLAQLHGVTLPGFGFLNTEKLAMEGVIEGLDRSLADYFNKRLNDHISYLENHALLSAEETERIRGLFQRSTPLLRRKTGSLLHRDFTFWNILGSEQKIHGVIDWDDAVSGDPADDIGIVNCFQEEDFMKILLEHYKQGIATEDDFEARIWLHTLRNMLWKTMIRDYMGYFNKGQDFFLFRNDRNLSLRDYTLEKIRNAMNKLEELL